MDSGLAASRRPGMTSAIFEYRWRAVCSCIPRLGSSRRSRARRTGRGRPIRRIGHAVAALVGLALGGVAMRTARIAWRRRTPVPESHPARRCLRPMVPSAANTMVAAIKRVDVRIMRLCLAAPARTIRKLAPLWACGDSDNGLPRGPAQAHQAVRHHGGDRQGARAESGGPRRHRARRRRAGFRHAGQHQGGGDQGDRERQGVEVHRGRRHGRSSRRRSSASSSARTISTTSRARSSSAPAASRCSTTR